MPIGYLYDTRRLFMMTAACFNDEFDMLYRNNYLITKRYLTHP